MQYYTHAHTLNVIKFIKYYLIMPLTLNKSVLLLNPFKYSAAFLVKSVQEKKSVLKKKKTTNSVCVCG